MVYFKAVGIVLLLFSSNVFAADLEYYPYRIPKEVLLEESRSASTFKERNFFCTNCEVVKNPVYRFKLHIEAAPAYRELRELGKIKLSAKKGASESDETSIRIKSKAVKIEYNRTFD